MEELVDNLVMDLVTDLIVSVHHDIIVGNLELEDNNDYLLEEVTSWFILLE